MGDKLIKSDDIVIRSLTARKIGGESFKARPLLSRPPGKDALGVIAPLRMVYDCHLFISSATLKPYHSIAVSRIAILRIYGLC